MSIGGSQRGSAAPARPKRKNWRCSRCACSSISQASAHIHEGGLRMAMNASQGGHEREGGAVRRTINGKLRTAGYMDVPAPPEAASERQKSRLLPARTRVVA